MRTFFYFLIIVTCSVLVGCSNDSDIISEDLNQDGDLSSFEELFQQDAKEFSGWKSSSQESSESQTRASINTVTLNGYSSKISGGNQKILILSDLADLMGIMSQIYIMEYVTAYQDLTIDGLGATSFFNAVNSPLCGIDPNGTNYKRGYSSSTPDENGNIRLATKCIHVISDMSGRSYDMWYPCRPEELQWIYNLINI